MPCRNCGRSISKPKCTGCRVLYCHCGNCNHCHIGFVHWGSENIGAHWFEDARSSKKCAPFIPGQSHGGHGAVPGCNKH
jgi:hypothetical protein